MKRLTLFVLFAVCCCCGTLKADPIAIEKIGPLVADKKSMAVSAFVSLWAESLVVVLLARRLHWLQDTSIWFLITTATYLLFIFLPLHLGIEIHSFGDVYGLVLLTLEAFVVACEAVILWLLWIRPKGFFRALGISLIGNFTSYGVSLLFLWGAFESHYKVLH